MTKTGRILLIILAAAGACRPAQAQEFRVKPDHTVVFGGHLLKDAPEAETAGGKIRPAASNKRSENGNGYIMLFLKASGTSL